MGTFFIEYKNSYTYTEPWLALGKFLGIPYLNYVLSNIGSLIYQNPMRLLATENNFKTFLVKCFEVNYISLSPFIYFYFLVDCKIIVYCITGKCFLYLLLKIKINTSCHNREQSFFRK